MRNTGIGERGYVLVIVMGLLAALLLMGLSLGAAGRTDLAQGQRFQEETSAEFLARAGITWAQHYLQAVNQRQAWWQASWQNDQDMFANRRLASGTFDLTYQDQQGVTHYGLQDEEARLNLMRAPAELLGALPGIGTSTAVAIVAQRQQQSLAIPEELVHRGLVSADLFYGQDPQEGLALYVTVWGNGKINVNTASGRVLAVVPGMTTAIVESIIRYRLGNDQQPGTPDDQYFSSLSDLARIAGITQPILDRCEPFLTVTPTAFRVLATGYPGQNRQSPSPYRRLAILERTANGMDVRYWRRVE